MYWVGGAIVVTCVAIYVMLWLILSAQVASAQNVSAAGNNWSSSWGFASASDRSVSLQRAQAIRSAQVGSSPTTVVNTTNYNNTNTDNRTNYIENITDQGGIQSDLHVGDAIGSNTNSVGSMNTGSTTIEIDGTGNVVDANNFADNGGCVDGSINSATSSATPSDNLFTGIGATTTIPGMSVSAQTCR